MMGRMLASRLSYANVTATLALFLALSGGAYAVTSAVGGSAAQKRVTDRLGRFHGCFKARGRNKGALRIVAPGSRCRRGERAIVWSQTGPTGPAGEAGAPGSDATVNGVAAGGSLTGTYPNPSIAAGAVGASELAEGVVAPRHMPRCRPCERKGNPASAC